jgi:membrane protein implicated in regulation of membrane protease activity
VKGIITFVGLNAGGAIGWWLGSFSGFTTSVVLSAVFSGVGLYVVRKLAERYLE